MIETFIRIEGYDNYEVSNYGDVMITHNGKILKQRKRKDGYKDTGLRKNGKVHTLNIHRLVAKAFLNNPKKKQFVDHIDNCKTNNNIKNLRWVTNRENQMNRSISNNNTSGVKGVCWNKQKKKWRASIKTYGITMHLGYYNNIEDAKQARIKKANELFGEYTNACEKE